MILKTNAPKSNETARDRQSKTMWEREERNELTHTTRGRTQGGDHPRVARAPMAKKRKPKETRKGPEEPDRRETGLIAESQR